MFYYQNYNIKNKTIKKNNCFTSSLYDILRWNLQGAFVTYQDKYCRIRWFHVFYLSSFFWSKRHNLFFSLLLRISRSCSFNLNLEDDIETLDLYCRKLLICWSTSSWTYFKSFSVFFYVFFS